MPNAETGGHMREGEGPRKPLSELITFIKKLPIEKRAQITWEDLAREFDMSTLETMREALEPVRADFLRHFEEVAVEAREGSDMLVATSEDDDIGVSSYLEDDTQDATTIYRLKSSTSSSTFQGMQKNIRGKRDLLVALMSTLEQAYHGIHTTNDDTSPKDLLGDFVLTVRKSLQDHDPMLEHIRQLREWTKELGDMQEVVQRYARADDSVERLIENKKELKAIEILTNSQEDWFDIMRQEQTRIMKLFQERIALHDKALPEDSDLQDPDKATDPRSLRNEQAYKDLADELWNASTRDRAGKIDVYQFAKDVLAVVDRIQQRIRELNILQDRVNNPDSSLKKVLDRQGKSAEDMVREMQAFVEKIQKEMQPLAPVLAVLNKWNLLKFQERKSGKVTWSAAGGMRELDQEIFPHFEYVLAKTTTGSERFPAIKHMQTGEEYALLGDETATEAARRLGGRLVIKKRRRS